MELVDKLFKTCLTKRVVTDNIVFRLHYQFTVTLLVLSGLVATAYQFYAHPIQCSIGQKNFRPEFINAYCYVYPTFLVNPDEQVTRLCA